MIPMIIRTYFEPFIQILLTFLLLIYFIITFSNNSYLIILSIYALQSKTFHSTIKI